MKLSVIIPIYNVEAYLPACLDCLVKHPCQDMEFILVNDGSLDNSDKIMQEFARKDARFVLLFKENGGLSDARNYALPYAKGKYLFFLDSDDLIREDAIDLILKAIEQEQSDLIVFDMEFFWEDSSQRKRIPGMVKESDQSVKNLLLATPSACNKVFKKEFIANNPFPKGMFYEDLASIPMNYPLLKKITYIEEALYLYRQRSGSIIYTFNDKALDIFECFRRILTFYKQHGYFQQYAEELEFLMIEHILLYANRRFLHSKQATNYIHQSYQFYKQYFHHYKKNKYYSLLSHNDRVFIQLATSNVTLLKVVVALKQWLKRS